MKKTITITILITVALVAMSQRIDLKFTGNLFSVGHISLDSVKIHNVTRMWTETLIYPDTVLSLSSLGIDEAQNGLSEMKVYPNPFKGMTNVALHLTESGPLSITIHDLSGRQVACFSDNLEAGGYSFNINLQKKQMYVLSVTTKQGRQAMKILNAEGGNGNSIVLNGRNNAFEKRLSTQYFQPGDVLQFRGYATYLGNSLESMPIEQAISSNEDFILRFSRFQDGVLPGRFSVSATTQVRFSQGNLQWSASGTHAISGGGTAPGTWRFANSQLDFVGDSRVGTVYVGNTKCDNSRASGTYTGWIDLFGWGTSGYNNKSPYLTSMSDSVYGNGNADITGTNYDWGVYNAISNGGNTPGMWRALTRNELAYLVNTRMSGALVGTTNNARYAMATVDGVKGVIIFPDSAKIQMTDVRWGAINDTCDFLTVINSTQWYSLENMGCVFLPAAGQRNLTLVSHSNEYGAYWSSASFGDDTTANHLHFAGQWNLGGTLVRSSFHTPCAAKRHTGMAVRLVKDVR